MLAALLKKILHGNDLVAEEDFEAVSAFVLGDFMYQEAKELHQDLLDLTAKKKVKVKAAKVNLREVLRQPQAPKL